MFAIHASTPWRVAEGSRQPKRSDSIYRSGDEPGTWLKHKLQRSEDFITGGYIPGRYGVDKLLVGIEEGKKLLFVESVKNGFVPNTRHQVLDALSGSETTDCPFSNLTEKNGSKAMDRDEMKKVRWVKPKIAAEIAFNEWTPAGHLRHSRSVRFRTAVEKRRR